MDCIVKLLIFSALLSGARSSPSQAPSAARKPTVPTPVVVVTSQQMTETPSLQEVEGKFQFVLPGLVKFLKELVI